VLIGELIDQAKLLGCSCSLAKCAASSLKKSISILDFRFFQAELHQFSAFLSGQRALTWTGEFTAIMRAWRFHLARPLTGMPRRWPTAVPASPSARQRETASYFCSGVNRRRARFGLLINQQFVGHGISYVVHSIKTG
jgi:hypothetical protein